jgi:glycosyltransferase involved in cell wall biosynthesis
VSDPDGRRVVLVAIAQRFGGVDVRVEQLARGLVARGRSHAVVVASGSEAELRLRAAGANVVGVRRRRGSPLAVRDLLAATAGEPSVIDAHNVQSQLWAAMAAGVRRDLGLVATMHSSYREEQSGRRSLRSHAYPLVPRLVATMGARVIAVSPAVARSARELGLADGRVAVIENAVAPSDGTPAAPWPAAWPEDAVVVLAVGRLEAVKAHADLVRALALVAAELPTLRVAIAGEGRERPVLEAEIARLGLRDRVYLTGFRRDVPALLAASDVFCMPSLSEGLPFALLEAGSAGLPVIASGVGGMAELLEHGRTARLVPPGDPAALARELRLLVEDPDGAGATARALHALIAKRFGVDRMIDRTLEEYDAAAADAPRRGRLAGLAAALGVRRGRRRRSEAAR